MKVCKSDKKENSLLKKINIIKVLIIVVIVFLICFGIFSLLSQYKNIMNSVKISLAISLLIGLEFALMDILDNRNRVFFINKNKITYIEVHEDNDGKYLTNKEFKRAISENDPKKIYDNIDDYEGFDKGEVIDVISIKKKVNKTIIKANVKTREWESVGRFTITKMFLTDKEKVKKIVIMNDYNNYEELINCFEKKKR